MSGEILEKYAKIKEIYDKYKEMRKVIGIKPINPFNSEEVKEALSGKRMISLIEELQSKYKAK